MNKINIIICALFFAGSAAAQDTLKLNLEQCRRMALKNSEKVQIANENIAKAKGQKLAARSAMAPNISASATGVYSRQEFSTEIYLPTKSFDPATGELVPNVVIDPVTGRPALGPDGTPIFSSYAYLPIDLTLNGGALAGVMAEQPVYAGGRIAAGKRMAQIGESMALEHKRLTQQEAIYETDRLYYNYLSVKEKLKLAQEYKNLLENVVKAANDGYETGMTNRNELLKAQVKLNEASLQVQKAQTGLHLSQMALCRAIGLDLNTPIEIGDSIGSDVLRAEFGSDAAVEERIEYRLLQKQAEMAGEQLKMIKGDYLPAVGVSAGYNYFHVDIENSDNFDSHGFSAIANVKIPIATFGERKGKIAAAKAGFHISQLELKQVASYLQLEIEQARLNLRDAYTRVEMAEKALEQATENMRVSDDNYALGMETLTSLLEAKAEWQNAYSNKIEALTDFKIKESAYLKATNRLDIENIE